MFYSFTILAALSLKLLKDLNKLTNKQNVRVESEYNQLKVPRQVKNQTVKISNIYVLLFLSVLLKYVCKFYNSSFYIVSSSLIIEIKSMYVYFRYTMIVTFISCAPVLMNYVIIVNNPVLWPPQSDRF